MADKKNSHKEFAEKILAKLPTAIRKEAELKAGGGEYTILKVRGKSVASVRNNNVRIVHPTDCSADSAKELAELIGKAAPEKKAEPKPKADKAKGSKSTEAKEGEDKGGEQEAGKDGDAK
jgi:hypothetical protein